MVPAASGRARISPGTNRRLCRLSYAGDWCWQGELNTRPPRYEGGALPTELCQRENLQTDGAPASHPDREAVARTPSNVWTLTMSNSAAIAGRISSVLTRARAFGARTTRLEEARTRMCCANAANPTSGTETIGISSLFGPSAPPACCGGGFGPAAGYSGLPNPSSGLLEFCEVAKHTDAHGRSLGR